jgi:hypothetical protein
MSTPFGPIVWRPLDHQSTMGAYVGQLARKGGLGVMANWRFADGADFLPPYEEVRALRKDSWNQWIYRQSSSSFLTGWRAPPPSFW